MQVAYQEEAEDMESFFFCFFLVFFFFYEIYA